MIFFHGIPVSTVIPGVGEHEFVGGGLPCPAFHPDVVGYNAVVDDAGDVAGKAGRHERAADDSFV